jgi:protein subunit release factor B
MPVSDGKLNDLVARMARVGLAEADIDEHFVRSSGAGGQKVNKTSSCVVLKHRPTGLEVKCQIERSQALNRYLARRILVEKLERQIFGARSDAIKKAWKIKKQKAKRSKRAKEKVLQAKHHQTEKKRMRGRVSGDF